MSSFKSECEKFKSYIRGPKIIRLVLLFQKLDIRLDYTRYHKAYIRL